MPAEPMIVLLRPRNFIQNPALDVPPLYSNTPSQVAARNSGIRSVVDNISRLAFDGKLEKPSSNDCRRK